jgi:rhodanese-related sulfurtransferase
MNCKVIIKSLLVIGILAVSLSCNRSSSFNGVDEMVTMALKKVEAITVEELKDKIDNGDMFLLLDVREPNEFNAGYIPGSLNIPRGTLEFRIANEEFWEAEMLYMPEKEEELVLYCKKAKRSILAAETLERMGYKNVKYLEDGWKHWEMTYPLIYEKNLDQMHHEEEEEVGGC